MDSAAVLLITLVVVGGVWGTMVLAAFLRRLVPRSEGAPDPRIEELQVDYRQLEARFEQLEEEVSFLRELRRPDSPARLSEPENEPTQD